MPSSLSLPFVNAFLDATRNVWRFQMVIRNCKAKTDSQYNRQKKRDPKKKPIIIYKRLHRKLDCGIRFPQKPGVNTFLKRYILELGIMGSCYLCSFELVVWLYFVFVCCVLFVGYRLNFAFKIIFFDTCMKNNTNKNRNKAWHTLFKISMNNWYKKIFFFFFLHNCNLFCHWNWRIKWHYTYVCRHQSLCTLFLFSIYPLICICGIILPEFVTPQYHFLSPMYCMVWNLSYLVLLNFLLTTSSSHLQL
jgi:hypothetical protein